MLDSMGIFVRSIGEQGVGTGEHETVKDVSVDIDRGVITVFDLGNLRLLDYDSVGTLRSAVQIRPFSSFTSAMARRHGVVFFSLPAGETYGQLIAATFDALDPSGKSVHRVVTVKAPAVKRQGSDLGGMPPFFLPRASWAVGPNGSITYASGAVSTIERYDSEGHGNLFLDTGVPTHTVTAADIAAEEKRTLQSFSPDWRARTESFVKRAAAGAAKNHPVFAAVRVLSDGTLWLREGSSSAADSVRWNVFKPSGAWLGWAKLPVSVRILGGRSDRLLVAKYDHPHQPFAEWVSVGEPSSSP